MPHMGGSIMRLVTGQTCERFRPLITSVIVASSIALTFLIVNGRSDKLWQNARRLVSGMNRASVVQIMGEPQEKLASAASPFGGPLIEFRYWTTPIGSRSTLEVGGIYFDIKEKRVVGISLTYGWAEPSGNELSFLVLWFLLAFEFLFCWWFVRKLCRLVAKRK